MYKHDLKTHAPRGDHRSATRRNDLGSLLRSRLVQGLLVATAAAQGTAMGVKHHAQAAPDLSAAMVAPAPVAVAPAPKLSAPVAVPAKAARKVQAEKPASASDKARQLARKYSRKGYRVTPALALKIHSAAVANDIDPEIAFGLVRTESSFQNSATSYVGAVGLTQLMPATARWLEPGVTVKQLRNPDTNLDIGFRYLRQLIDDYEGDTDLALLAYNRGPGTVNRILKRGGDPDNGYADKVRGR